MSDALLEINDVTKHFPVTRGIIFQKQVAAVKAVDGVTFRSSGGDARHRRRVRLREVDTRTRDHAPPGADERLRDLRRQRHLTALAGRDATGAPGDDDDLSGSRMRR